MSKRLLLLFLFLTVGAVSSLSSRALADPGDDAICGSCVAGIGIWNQVIPVVDSNGNPCFIGMTWWRQDGSCIEIDEDCVEESACKYLAVTQSTCANPNGEWMVQVSSPGGLNFSTGGAGAKVVGAPFCGWATQFSTCAVNLLTGAVVCGTNWASCGSCGELPPDATEGD